MEPIAIRGYFWSQTLVTKIIANKQGIAAGFYRLQITDEFKNLDSYINIFSKYHPTFFEQFIEAVNFIVQHSEDAHLINIMTKTLDNCGHFKEEVDIARENAFHWYNLYFFHPDAWEIEKERILNDSDFPEGFTQFLSWSITYYLGTFIPSLPEEGFEEAILLIIDKYLQDTERSDDIPPTIFFSAREYYIPSSCHQLPILGR